MRPAMGESLLGRLPLPRPVLRRRGVRPAEERPPERLAAAEAQTLGDVVDGAGGGGQFLYGAGAAPFILDRAGGYPLLR